MAEALLGYLWGDDDDDDDVDVDNNNNNNKLPVMIQDAWRRLSPAQI